MSKNNEKPLVSIITVCYNSEKYIRDTIESVLNQTYDNIEYIIVDGESADNTLDIIKEYEPRFNGRMRWISEPDDGIYDAMNKGIDMANGEIIGIINSDDWYELNSLEKIVKKFQSSNVDMVHGNLIIWEKNKLSYIKKYRSELRDLKKGMLINHPTVFLGENVYEQLGYFDTNFDIAADWELMLRIINANNFNIKYINEKIANFRLGGKSYTLNKALVREKHKIRRKYYGKLRFDFYYYFDLIKLLLPERLVLRINKIKNRLIN